MSVTLSAKVILAYANDPGCALLSTVLVQLIVFLHLKYVESQTYIWHEFYPTPGRILSYAKLTFLWIFILDDL